MAQVQGIAPGGFQPVLLAEPVHGASLRASEEAAILSRADIASWAQARLNRRVFIGDFGESPDECHSIQRISGYGLTLEDNFEVAAFEMSTRGPQGSVRGAVARAEEMALEVDALFVDFPQGLNLAGHHVVYMGRDSDPVEVDVDDRGRRIWLSRVRVEVERIASATL